MTKSRGQPKSPTPPVDPYELRCNPRVGTDLGVEIHSAQFAIPLRGRTRDLGIGGACIATDSPFDFKSLHQLVLILPEGPIRLRAEGRWQREEPAGDLVLTGLEFYQPSAEEHDVVWDLVLDGGKRLARFFYEHSSLRELGLEEAMGLAQVTRYRDLPLGHTLYRQRSQNRGEDSIFLIERGQVSLQVRVRDAIEKEIARLGPGDVFGGLPLLAKVGHCESAVTCSPVRLLEIDH